MGSSSHYHHGNLKTALIEAGLSQIQENGFEGISLRTVAKRAGVSHTAPYRHFKDKSHLLAAVAQKAYLELSQKLDRIAERYPHHAEEALIKSVMAYLEIPVEQPRKAQLMFCPQELDQTAQEILKQAAEKPKQQIFELISTNSPEISAQEALKIWSALYGLVNMILLGFINVGDDQKESLRNLSEELLGFHHKPG